MNLNLYKKNIKSGVTVALISIPLSISLAVASGVSPLVGIITAIWAGLFASLFGGSNFNIIGPTGALSGLIATYVLINGVAGLPILTLMVGVFILVAYILKLEKYLILIPSCVIHGFTLGVAFIIALGQLNFALGLTNLVVHEKFFENIFESLKNISSTSYIAVLIFCLFLIGLLIFKRFIKKIPGAIILAPVGILLGYLSYVKIISYPIQTLGSKFGDINFSFIGNVHFTFSFVMIETALVIALIAILETMLSAKIADGMTRTKHNGRKEMFGLGLANIASGLFGGMPATAALARTSVNIKNGANDKSSATISVVTVSLISVFLLGYFKYIPLAVIAAILVFTAIQMVERENFKKLWKYDRNGFLVSIIVALITVIYDPIYGILVGVSISLLVFVNRISQGHFKLKVSNIEKGIVDYDSGVTLKEMKGEGDVLLYSFSGKLCYINGRAHLLRFETNLVKYKSIILRLREVNFIDPDGVEVLDEIIDIIESRGQVVLLTGVSKNNHQLIEKLSTGYKKLKQNGLVFKKSEHALTFLGVPLHGKQ